MVVLSQQSVMRRKMPFKHLINIIQLATLPRHQVHRPRPRPQTLHRMIAPRLNSSSLTILSWWLEVMQIVRATVFVHLIKKAKKRVHVVLIDLHPLV